MSLWEQLFGSKIEDNSQQQLTTSTQGTQLQITTPNYSTPNMQIPGGFVINRDPPRTPQEIEDLKNSYATDRNNVFKALPSSARELLINKATIKNAKHKLAQLERSHEWQRYQKEQQWEMFGRMSGKSPIDFFHNGYSSMIGYPLSVDEYDLGFSLEEMIKLHTEATVEENLMG